MAGGRVVEIPTDSDGRVNVEELRRTPGVAPHRALIRQTPEGENYVLPQHGTIEVGPYDQFLDAARGIRGRE